MNINPASTGDPLTFSNEEILTASTHALQLSALLHTNLDPDKLLELFNIELKKIVTHDYLRYRNGDFDLTVDIGIPCRHSLAYRLELKEHPLGELKISRKKQFNEDEITKIKNVLRSLFYPLRNALLFRKALESAHTDSLTGIGNRGAMESALQREVRLSHRHNMPLTLIVMDIDKFKFINDTYGNSIGDAMLKRLVECIQGCIRSTDIFCRYGGEEFAVLLPNTILDGGSLLARRIRQKVSESSYRIHGTNINLTISLGVASLCPEDDDKHLLERADLAMYRSKQQGGNCVTLA